VVISIAQENDNGDEIDIAKNINNSQLINI